MTTYYKAVRPDGTDFYSGTVQWIPADGIPTEGWLVEHPTERRYRTSDASRYLSVSTVQTDCTGMAWPCRLLRVEPVGRVGAPNRKPNKRCARAWRVVEELDPHIALGPQGGEVAAVIERARRLSSDEAVRLKEARDAAWDATRHVAGRPAWVVTWDAAWKAAQVAARDAAWDAAWNAALFAGLAAARIVSAAQDAAQGAAWGSARISARNAARGTITDVTRDAALAVLVRDLISDEHYKTLAGPWLSVIKEER